ncbi:chorismate mutase [Streptococcus azizii]|uniref:Chorismate mutase n=1 Tax=Streptococcus azizii TaxID=1579424 RepID=A0AB36JQK8_9STRE|nr:MULTISPECIES: chorismate mutase [Streptococcus]MBF0775928.1 chorismate mutase [Streptococcus sp. 19428wD3_AN2]ONK27508.1 chorismate mutase [Streptococcus azizii]ONK28745.1 chorismate mutase [Streptococcus azizii]ONK29441.1 chorismate mutase [Streptococcus azizii]TFU83975.1 chorismate mutase [Streptococcus sp. AN2]
MLSKQREKIDQIDREIVRLFEERMQTALEVVAIKKAEGLPVLDSGREAQVLEKVSSYLNDLALREPLIELYTEIMRLSRAYQQKQLD